MEKVQQLFAAHKKLFLAGLAAAGLLLLILIGVLVASLVRTDAPASSSSDSNSKSDFSSGGSSFSGSGASDLSGTTGSYSNLKGLSLRINQVDTCNPNVVSAYVAVTSKEGDVNKSFSKKDVKIYLDGKQVQDFDFATVDTTKLPLANMLVIDHSGSMRGSSMDNAKAAATDYVSKLKTNDQVGVMQFDDQIDVLAALSPDKKAAKNAIATITPRGNTALFDAAADAISKVPNCGRKAVTILTDGDDTASKTNTASSVIGAANKATLPIFSVGIKSADFTPGVLESISQGTGGQFFQANTPEEIASLYGKIDAQLTGQFAANLKITLKKDGASHTLRMVSTVAGSDTAAERSFVY